MSSEIAVQEASIQIRDHLASSLAITETSQLELLTQVSTDYVDLNGITLEYLEIGLDEEIYKAIKDSFFIQLEKNSLLASQDRLGTRLKNDLLEHAKFLSTPEQQRRRAELIKQSFMSQIGGYNQELQDHYRKEGSK